MLASSEENKSCSEDQEEEHVTSPATAPKLASREKERRSSSQEGEEVTQLLYMPVVLPQLNS